MSNKVHFDIMTRTFNSNILCRPPLESVVYVLLRSASAFVKASAYDPSSAGLMLLMNCTNSAVEDEDLTTSSFD